jgi:hypothetical protein
MGASSYETGGVQQASVVFGFDVRSQLAFHYLRRGSGVPLEVEEVLLEPSDPGRLLEASPYRPGQRGRTQVYEDGSAFNLWVDHAGWFRVDPAVPRITVPPSDYPAWREAIIWGLPAALCVLDRGDMMVHAAAVKVGDGAIVLAAPGGHGKTTLASAFVSAGFKLISEDLVALDVARRVVFPGPEVMRLRRDVADQKPSGARVVAEDTEKLHLALDESARAAGNPLAVHGVAFLRPSHEGITLTPVSADAALPDLWSLALRLPTDEGRSACFANVVDLVQAIPVWNLARPPRRSALQPTIELLVANFT